jgi:Amt family ammonium transporter
MVGKKCNQHHAAKFMAMIVVTILWVVIGFGFRSGPSIGGIIGNPLQTCSFKVLVFKLLDFAVVPFLLFALFQAKLQ